MIAFVDAMNWISSVMTGAVASALAILAIGFVGTLLLFGHIRYEYTFRVVLGCFIIFGAARIAMALTLLGGHANSPELYQTATLTPAPFYVESGAPPSASDPYSGAAIPHSQPETDFSLE